MNYSSKKLQSSKELPVAFDAERIKTITNAKKIISSFRKKDLVNSFIENFSDIQALIEITDHSKTHLPSILDREMRNYLSDTDFNGKIDVRFDVDVWWFDSEHYDTEQEKGAYFGYDAQWKSLFNGNDPGDASYLYLYIDSVIKTLKAKATELRKLNINFVDDIDYDEPYILKYPLHREFNMVTIKDREKLKMKVQKAVKHFTSGCMAALSG